MRTLTLNGVPPKLANDGWWLNETPNAPDGPKPPAGLRYLKGDIGRATAVLLALIATSDVLFWGQPFGLSLIVFSAILTVAALFSLRPNLTRKETLTAASLWLLCALPLVEYLQFISVAFLVLGHLGILIWCAGKAPAQSVFKRLLWSPWIFVKCACLSAIGLSHIASNEKALHVDRQTVAAWVLPLGIGFVFCALMIGANPVFENWLSGLDDLDVSGDTLARVLFWGGMALALLPFALFKATALEFSKIKPNAPKTRPLVGALLNPRSVMNGLILFNLIFALQNMTDLTYLWGGFALPDGMTYAEFAHRGAYPLMATSILAAAFALMSRRFVGTSPLIRLLLAVWIVQNLVLLTSAVARLELYVDVYGLTYLRVRAAIGMALVGVGLALLLWQVWKHASDTWVTQIFAATFIATLYVGAFVNFGAVIAQHNVTLTKVETDVRYLCRYTPSGIGAFREQAQASSYWRCDSLLQGNTFAIAGWRDWSFRKARLNRITVADDLATTPIYTLPQITRGTHGTQNPSHR